MVKQCSHCNRILSEDNFYKKKGRTSLSCYCKKCSVQFVIDKTISNKLKMISYKGGKCEDCGITDIRLLCLHHLNPKEKEFRWNKLKFKSWNSIKKEVDKCALLCYNCHVLRHSKSEVA